MAKDHRIADPTLTEVQIDFVDDADRSLNPYGRFLRHNYMHAGVIPMILDEFGRCAYCIKQGNWRSDA